MIAVSIDGVRVAPEAAAISVFDRGLLFGDGLFEVLRTWGGKPVDLERHLDRLYESARYLKLAACAREVLAESVARTVAAAGEGEHRIRVVVTRGPGGIAAAPASLGPGRAIVIVEPLGPQPTEISVATVDLPLPRRHGRGHKFLAYVDHVLARMRTDADEAIRLDAAGDVCEGATSNLFAVRGGGAVTPAVDTGALPGIVRGRVLELCASLAIPVAVRALPLAELHDADEIFVTSSLRGVVAVTRLDDEPRIAGSTTARLRAAYVACMLDAAKL